MISQALPAPPPRQRKRGVGAAEGDLLQRTKEETMGNAITTNLYTIEIEMMRGNIPCERVFPDGESECVDVETAEKRLATYTDLLRMGMPIEGRGASNIVTIHLMAVEFQGEAETGKRAVETRRKHWNWTGAPLGVAA